MEQEIPEKYKNKMISIGEGQFGWKKEDILEFLSDRCSDCFAVLGGDVLSYDSERQRYDCTYDSWHLERNGPQENFSDYCLRSQKKAIEYIQNYKTQNGILFVPVMTSEVTGGLTEI